MSYLGQSQSDRTRNSYITLAMCILVLYCRTRWFVPSSVFLSIILFFSICIDPEQLIILHLESVFIFPLRRSSPFRNIYDYTFGDIITAWHLCVPEKDIAIICTQVHWDFYHLAVSNPPLPPSHKKRMRDTLKCSNHTDFYHHIVLIMSFAFWL